MSLNEGVHSDLAGVAWLILLLLFGEANVIEIVLKGEDQIKLKYPLCNDRLEVDGKVQLCDVAEIIL